jgi:hypothetical protein
VCLQCSQALHSKGKFLTHCRRASQSPHQLKRLDTLPTDNCEEEPARISKKEQDNQEYGFKTRERPPKQMTTSVVTKKGRSVAKTGLDNQENTPFRNRRKSSVQENDLHGSTRREAATEPWLLCSRHGKRRNVLTDCFDLLCCDCYEDVRGVVGRIKTLELEGWLEDERTSARAVIEGTAEFAALKETELSIEFSRHKLEL